MRTDEGTFDHGDGAGEPLMPAGKTPVCPFCPATTVRRAGALTCPDCDWHERRGAD